MNTEDIEEKIAEFKKITEGATILLRQISIKHGMSFQLSMYQTIGEGYFHVFTNDNEDERLHTAWLLKGVRKSEELLEQRFEMLKPG